MSRISLPPIGWFIDIETADSISAIRRNLGHALHTAGADDLTTAHLRGDNRHLTTAIAEWIHGTALDNDTYPVGIVYGSKHDSHWTNWAIWKREPVTGDADPFPTAVIDTYAIEEPVHNPALNRVCKLFGLHCH